MSDHIRSEDLAAYVDGLLSAAKKSELENHFSRCPACLDELAEITAIGRGREKIPAHVLRSALSGAKKKARAPLPLRLVFEIAAALVVVVFIGYLFLSGNRFWQPTEIQRPLALKDKNILAMDDETAARAGKTVPQAAPRLNRGADKKSTSRGNESNGLQRSADAAISKEIADAATEKDMSAVGGQSRHASEKEDDLRARLEEHPPAAAEKPSFKKGTARIPATTQARAEGQKKSAAKGQPPAKVLEVKGTDADQNLERQIEPGTTTAPPDKEAGFSEEEISKQGSTAVPAAMGDLRSADAQKKREVIVKQKGIADLPSGSPVRIEGDVSWSDLRNPGLLAAWSWFPEGLALELHIDASGTVLSVAAQGECDPALTKQAINEAKKLLFVTSGKKVRRGLLAANEMPPNPKEP